MTKPLRLSQGAFVTFNGGKFQLGHVDAPYHVHEVRRPVLQLVTSFAEPSDPRKVLGTLQGEVRAAVERFLEELVAEGILTADPPSEAGDIKKTVFEIARTTEVYSDIGRVHPRFLEAWRRVEGQTLTSMPLGLALWNACRHVVSAGVPGAVVECGVWQGGSMLLAALALMEHGERQRPLYLYDIFEWSWEAPTGADGFFLSQDEQRRANPGVAAPDWERRVAAKLADAGYPAERIRTVRGRVQETIPAVAPDQIALLRLDTDYHDSTLHELEQLYPRLAPGGILLVDDYGRLDGATRAVDEYFAAHGVKMMLNRIDAQGCIGVKQL